MARGGHRPLWAGYVFGLWARRLHVNLKSYYELAAQDRPDGWNAWLSLLIPLSAPKR